MPFRSHFPMHSGAGGDNSKYGIFKDGGMLKVASRGGTAQKQSFALVNFMSGSFKLLPYKEHRHLSYTCRRVLENLSADVKHIMLTLVALDLRGPNEYFGKLSLAVIICFVTAHQGYAYVCESVNFIIQHDRIDRNF